MSLVLPESPVYQSAAYQTPAASDSVPGHQLGIPFGLYHLPETEFAPPFTSALRNGTDPAEVIPILEAARKAGVKVFLNMFVSRRQIQNPDGSFSLERWKQRIDRFRSLGLEPFISDGTLAGNYLMDEPDSRGKWNGAAVPYDDIEAAAAYSKQLWPGLPTMIRADPLFLQKAPFRWVYLDAAWAQYTTRKGSVEDYARRHAAVARIGWGRITASASKRLPARRQKTGRMKCSAGTRVSSLSCSTKRPVSSASTEMSASTPGFSVPISSAMPSIAAQLLVTIGTTCSIVRPSPSMLVIAEASEKLW